MSLLEQIKQDRERALEMGSTRQRAALTLALGEIERVNSKGATDAEVTAVISKILKNNAEMLSHLPDDEVFKTAQLHYETSLLGIYLPEQLCDAQIKSIIENLIDSNPTGIKIGEVMKFFKANFADQYDAKIVKEIFSDS